MTKEKKANFAFLAAILLVAFNLRSPITGVGTLVRSIQSDLQLSGSVAGFLTTIPLLAFALVSPLASRIARKVGLGRALFLSLSVLTVGILLRSNLGQSGLLAGTAVIGIGIACANVLLPVVVKARYPDRIGFMTGMYSTAQTVFAGLSSAICVPLAALTGLGWRFALGVWALPSAIAALLWFSRRSLTIDDTPRESDRPVNVWRSPVAWFCTLYMGTQALLFYSVSAWLPSILASRGVDAATAGMLASLYQLIGIPANFLTPLIAGRMKNHRLLTGAISALYVPGMVLLWAARGMGAITASVLLIGFSTGCCFSLCMALIGLRTRCAADAAALSGMLQSVGYLIAAAGPVVVGKLFDISGGWTWPVIALIAGTLFNALLGQLAGRPGTVE